MENKEIAEFALLGMLHERTEAVYNVCVSWEVGIYDIFDILSPRIRITFKQNSFLYEMTPHWQDFKIDLEYFQYLIDKAFLAYREYLRTK